MKKILILLVCTLLCSNIAFANPIIYEKPDVKIIVEGSELELASEVPVIVNSRTLVPLRKLLVGLGVPDNTENIQWIGETREVKVVYNGVTINLAIDSLKGYINGQEYTLDSAPIIHKDRTYLPARFVGEALGYTISWDQYTPAVLVTSNKNMDKLREILNDLNTAVNNVNSYEVASLRKTNIEYKYEGKIDKNEYTVKSVERADLRKKIVYTENNYVDEFENSFNLHYNTDKAFYNCYKYFDNNTLYDDGWKKIDYQSEVDTETPFEVKEKIALINFDNSIYGSLLYKEYDNAYVVSNMSNQIDILKVIDGMELYDEVSSLGNVEEFGFQLAIAKDTKLPMSMKINYKLNSYENAGVNGAGIQTIENTEYLVDFLEYNQYLTLELPEV